MQKKRFIAGASCPNCGEIDAVFTYESAQKKWCACTKCNFNESTDALRTSAEELPTRVNQPRVGEDALAHETSIDVIRFFND